MLYKLYVREQISEMHIQKFMQYNYFRQEHIVLVVEVNIGTKSLHNLCMTLL